MANFSFGNDYRLHIRSQPHANMYPGWGVHRLLLSFEVTAHGDYTPEAPFLVQGELWAHELPGPASWIGALRTDWPIGLQPFGTMLNLETTVTDRQLRGLEKAREGRDLTLRAHLAVIGLAETQRWPAASDQEMIRIPHATWSNALTQLDIGAFVDVLVPITDVEGRATAARRIREAQTAIHDGSYEHAVMLARAALDHIRDVCGTIKLSQQAPKNPKERDQPTRWAVLIQSAYQLFSGASHDDAGTTENFTWTRADAVAAVATAAGLLARLEEQP